MPGLVPAELRASSGGVVAGLQVALYLVEFATRKPGTPLVTGPIRRSVVGIVESRLVIGFFRVVALPIGVLDRRIDFLRDRLAGKPAGDCPGRRAHRSAYRACNRAGGSAGRHAPCCSTHTGTDGMRAWGSRDGIAI